MNSLNLQSLIIISEQTTPVMYPPDLQISEAEFLNQLHGKIKTYQLPVLVEYCNLIYHHELPIQEQLLVGVEELKYRYLKVLVGVQKLGALAYVERRQILIPPQLPSELRENSPELPPRLTIQSGELPAKSPMKQTSQTVTFKSEAHKERVMLIERRRLERYQAIQQRKWERARLLDDWQTEVLRVIDEVDYNPRLNYLKDSVDLMIKSVISDFTDRGAQVKETDEKTRREEELKKRAKDVRRNF